MKAQAHRALAAAVLIIGGFVAWRMYFPGFFSAAQPAAVIPSVESWQRTADVPVIYLATTTANISPYIEIIDSCGPYYDGDPCVNLRTGPGKDFPLALKARHNMVLKVASSTVVDGHTWYQIGFDGEIHYPERVAGSWWVASEYTHLFFDPGEIATTSMDKNSSKRIVVNLHEEMLYAYDGETLFMKQPISAGLELTPTPAGHFFVFLKRPDSYMQGPVPHVSDQYYDLPGVPWDLYFTTDGAAIHGAYWHDHFGQPWSHGCVNLPPAAAETLYEWTPVGTPVIVER